MVIVGVLRKWMLLLGLGTGFGGSVGVTGLHINYLKPSRDISRDQQFAQLPDSRPPSRSGADLSGSGAGVRMFRSTKSPRMSCGESLPCPVKRIFHTAQSQHFKTPLLLRQKINTTQKYTLNTSTRPAVHTPNLGRTSEAYKCGGAPATSTGVCVPALP